MNMELTARLQMQINDVVFIAENDYATLDELACGMRGMNEQLGLNAAVTLQAAMLTFQLEHGLDDASEEVLGDFMDTLGMGAEHFLSESAGTYDRYVNRIEPLDLGMVFPDGSVRVVWDKSQAMQPLRASHDAVVKAIALLVQAQKDYQAPSEEELDDDVDEHDAQIEQRTELLRAHGLMLDNVPA